MNFYTFSRKGIFRYPKKKNLLIRRLYIHWIFSFYLECEGKVCCSIAECWREITRRHKRMDGWNIQARKISISFLFFFLFRLVEFVRGVTSDWWRLLFRIIIFFRNLPWIYDAESFAPAGDSSSFYLCFHPRRKKINLFSIFCCRRRAISITGRYYSTLAKTWYCEPPPLL